MANHWMFPTIGALLLASLASTLPAVASPISAIYTINAAGFGDILGSTPAPADPVRLDVAISFDPAVGDQFDYGVGISLRGSSIAVGGPISYDYDSTNDILTIGGAGLSTSLTAGTNDVLVELDGVRTGAPTFGGAEYTTALSSGIYLSTTGRVAVPEPGSMLVLVGGLFGLASVRRRS